jgi:integrase
MSKGRSFKPKNADEEKVYKLFLKSHKIEECLSRCKDNLRKNYFPCLRDFFIFIDKDPEKYIIDMDTILDRSEVIEYRKTVENDILKYFNHLLNLKKVPSPSSFHQNKSALYKLLKTHNIVLSDRFLDDLRRLLPKNTAITSFEVPTLNQLETIINHLDVQGKAMFLTQFSSGSRIEEMLSIRIEDLELNHEFPRFKIRYESSKNGKFTIKRCSPEAKKWILEYLKVRDTWLETKRNKTNDKGRNGEQGRLFPMSKQNANEKWINALKKAGLYKKDTSSGIASMSTHSLRKLFRKQCKKAEQTDFGRWMANHGRNIDDTYIYDDYNPNEIDQEYSKILPNLLIFGKTEITDIEVLKLRKEMEEMKQILSKNDYMIYEGIVYQRLNEIWNAKVYGPINAELDKVGNFKPGNKIIQKMKNGEIRVISNGGEDIKIYPDD